MRNVTRGQEPQVLVENAETWTAELLAEVERCDGTDERVEDKFFDKYRRDEVRDELKRMYGGYCCYCEDSIEPVSYPHIEHRRSKRTWPPGAFAWDNLHLSCTQCNTLKGEKWNAAAPILDSCVDPIEQHLTYKFSATGLRRWPANDSRRGDTTIRHAGLNRGAPDGLPGARFRVVAGILDLILEIKAAGPGSPNARAFIEELEAKVTGQYGSMIAWIMKSFLDDEPAPDGQ